MDGKFHLPGWGITILLAILGGILGAVDSGLNSAGWLARWQKIGVLPERAVHFEAIELGAWSQREADLDIQMVSGRIFQYKASERSWYELAGYEPGSGKINLNGCESQYNSPKGAFSRLPARVVICGYFNWKAEASSDTSYYVVLEDNTVWMWLQKADPIGSMGLLGWDELTAIGVGWLVIGGFRIIPDESSRWAKFGYGLLVLGIAAAVLWLFRVLAPTVNGILLVGLLSSGGVWGCICIGAIVLGGVIILKIGRDRYV